MFRITEDPPSWRLAQCLAKNYKNGSNVCIDVDKVGVVATYSDLCLSGFTYSEIHTLTTGQNMLP